MLLVKGALRRLKKARSTTARFIMSKISKSILRKQSPQRTRRNFATARAERRSEIVVKNPKVRIPLIDTLRQQLQKHVCLREIMSNPEREVVLRDLRGGSANRINYVFPEGEVAIQDLPLTLSDFPDVKATLTVLRAKGSDALSQTGSDRTGGILITSKRTVHEATLFGFDDDPHAAKLFGELRCDAIYELQAKGEPVVDKNRSGLHTGS